MDVEPSIASSYAQFFSEEPQQDALTVRHATHPESAENLQRILRTFGLASGVFDRVLGSRKRKIVEEGSKLIVDDIRFTGHSFKYFGVAHPLRLAAIRIVTYHKYNTIMALLFSLSAGLLFFRSDPSDLFPDDSWTTGQYVALVIDRLMIILFVLDILVSFIAHGILKCMRQLRYLLDALVLVAAITQEMSSDSLNSSTVLFAVSSLRPLRIAPRCPSMMRLINILAACSDKLVQVALLILGICVAFAAAAVILFRDASHTRCYNPTTNMWGSSCNFQSNSDPTDFLYAPCMSGSQCLTNGPNLAPFSSYDNIGSAMLVLLQILTLDNWAELAVDMMNSLTPAAGIFFVLSTFLLAYWATNQFTAVIFDSFSTTFVEEREMKARRHNKDDGEVVASAPTKRFTSLKGTAPQAHRAVQNMKQSIAQDSIASMKAGLKSVNVSQYVKAEAQRAAQQDDAAQRSRREKDFFLDDTTFDHALDVVYRYQQLEPTLPPGAQKLLSEFKRRPYRNERERNSVLNQFHIMNDRTREKMLSFLHWREEVDESLHGASNGNVQQRSRGVRWADESAVANDPSASLAEDLSKPLVPDAEKNHVGSPTTACAYVPPTIGLVDTSVALPESDSEDQELSSRSSQGISGEKRAPRVRRPRLQRNQTEMREYLNHLREEHRELWNLVSGVVPQLRAARSESKAKVRQAFLKEANRASSVSAASSNAHMITVPPLRENDEVEMMPMNASSLDSVVPPAHHGVANEAHQPPLIDERDLRDESSTSSSSSTESPSSSSSTSEDTVDLAVKLHERLSMGNDATSARDTMHNLAVKAALAVRRRQQQVRDAHRWKSAKSLDEFLELGDMDTSAETDGHRRGFSSAGETVVDVAMGIEEFRRANKMLLELLREYNASRTLPRPQPSRWESIVRSIGSYQPRVHLYQLLRSWWYDKTILVATLLNCQLLMFVHYDADPGYDVFIDTVSAVVDVIIIFDTLSRIALTSFRTYFAIARRNAFNVVEFLIMALCTADLVVSSTGIFPFLRVFRVLRAMKFMRRFHLLRQLLILLRTSLGYLMNLLALQIMVWLVFTYCGRQLLGESFQSSEVLQPCDGFRTQEACDYESENCIWVNGEEWMGWSTSYMRSLKIEKTKPLLPSRTWSRSRTVPKQSHVRVPSHTVSRTIPLGRHTRSLDFTASDSQSPAFSSSRSLSIRETETALSWTRPNASDVDPSSGGGSVLTSYRCRQFQGWDYVDPFSRFSFETLTFSFVTVFDITTKDNWSTIQYHYMEQVGVFMFIFFMMVIVVCGYLILSLLVAILLVNFEQRDEVDLNNLKDDTEAFDQDVIATQGQTNAALERIANESLRHHLIQRDAEDTRRKAIHDRQRAEVQRLHAEAKEKEAKRQQKRDQAMLRTAAAERVANNTTMEKEAPAVAVQEGRFARFKVAAIRFFTLSEAAKKSTLFRWIQMLWLFLANFCDALDTEVEVVEGKSLFLFRPENRLRKFLVALIGGTYFPFEKCVFWVTLLHCFVSPSSPKLIESTAMLTVFQVVDWIISTLGVLEILGRCIAMGGFIGPHSYVRSGGLVSVAEILLVSVSFTSNVLPPIVSSLTSGEHQGTAIGFALKGFRPFRAVSRTSSMRNVMVAISRTVPELVSILAFSVVLYVMFSIMCVQAFRGHLRRCSDGSDRSQAECVGNWTALRDAELVQFPDAVGNATELVLAREWRNMNEFHFDDCYNAFTTLFKVSLVSNWGAVMYAMIDAPEVAGDSPVRNYFPARAGWLIFWVIFSNNFLINIFVGTIVDRFSKLKDQLQGNLFISAEQSEIARIKKSLVTKTAKKVLRLPPVPWADPRLNEISFSIVSHVVFVKAIKYILVVNTVIIMTAHYQQQEWVTRFQEYSTSLCTFIFIVEAALKVCVGGWELYFSVPFHFVEAAAVIQGIIEFGFVFRGQEPPDSIQVFRLVRVARLVRDAKGLRKILHTGFRALPAMGNIGAVLVAVIFSFAMVGIALFQDVRYDLSGNWFSPMFSLRTLPKAMFTLYSVATLDNWSQVQYIAGVSEPNCRASESHDCGNMLLASLFLNIFVVTVTLIMLNLFMAVVLENFSDAVLLPQYLEERQRDVEAFRKVWSQFDDGRNVISASSMVPLLEALPGPQQRYEQLKSTRDAAGDDDSAHSLQSEEMRVYAENQTIGLGGCPSGSIIHTVQQLKLVVTMPNEEILYLDAISAIGEKIYHAQLVDERIRRAHERALIDAEETQLSFAVWYATSRFQKLFRARLKEQRHYALVRAEEKTAVILDPSKAGAFIPPRHASSGSPLWNAVLDPIVVLFVRQHFRSAWISDGGSTMRKVTLAKRVVGTAGADENDVVEDEDVRQQRQLILEEVEKRQPKSLAVTIKERQVEVEEAPEVVEDLSWATVIQFEELGTAGGADHSTVNVSSVAKNRKAAFGLQSRLEVETGLLCHAPPLDALIQSRRRALLFQLFAQSFQQKDSYDVSKLHALAQQTTVQLRAELTQQQTNMTGADWNMDVWNARSYQWKPQAPHSFWERIPAGTWRADLSIPAARRLLDVQKKRKGAGALPVSKEHLPLVADWGVLFRIGNDAIVSRIKIRQAAREAVEVAPGSPSATSLLNFEASQSADSPVLDASTRSEPLYGSSVTVVETARKRHHPTLLEKMEEMGMSTTQMRLAEERRRAEEAARAAAAGHSMSALDRITASFASPSAKIAHTPHSVATNSFVHGVHRSSAPSIRFMMEEGTPLSPAAKELFQLENRGLAGEHLTTSNTAGSYSLPVEEDDGAPKLSFAVMTRLCMAARRFKRKKMEAETEALRRRVRGHGGAMSAHSKVSKGQETDGSASRGTAITGLMTDAFKRAAGNASALKKRGEGALAMLRKAKKKIVDGAMSPRDDSPHEGPATGGDNDDGNPS